jgi:hypothetical protein
MANESGSFVDDDVPLPRSTSRGRTCVYVLPCRDEDVLKVGYSRDPLQRMRSLHRRFFEFFDLDRGLLIEAERLRDARRIERLFIDRLAAQRAPPPLVVREAAAGYTEWFRGVAPQAEALAHALGAGEGLAVHALRPWLRARLDERGDALYGWSTRMLEALEYQHFNPPPEARDRALARALRDTLDACAAVGLDLAGRVPPAVLEWRAATDYFDRR